MTIYANDDFDDYILCEVEIHDSHTGYNWTAEIAGRPDDVGRQWLRTELLLARAGFLPGWPSDGVHRGAVDHLVLVKEAVDRCWLQHAADLVP